MIEQLKIGGTNYRVIYEADPLNPDGSVIYGQTDVSLAIICINSKLEASVQLSTLLHETIHGILNHAGYADEHPEKLIEIIANGLLQVLGDNAELRKALPYHEETN